MAMVTAPQLGPANGHCTNPLRRSSVATTACLRQIEYLWATRRDVRCGPASAPTLRPRLGRVNRRVANLAGNAMRQGIRPAPHNGERSFARHDPHGLQRRHGAAHRGVWRHVTVSPHVVETALAAARLKQSTSAFSLRLCSIAYIQSSRVRCPHCRRPTHRRNGKKFSWPIVLHLSRTRLQRTALALQRSTRVPVTSRSSTRTRSPPNVAIPTLRRAYARTPGLRMVSRRSSMSYATLWRRPCAKTVRREWFRCQLQWSPVSNSRRLRDTKH